MKTLALTLALFIVSPLALIAQTINANDPYLPIKNKFKAGLYTTYRGSAIAAPVLIGELTYGISNRFSLSVVGGTTGTLALVGTRIAANLYEKKNFRLLYRMSIIYYPERNGTFLFDNNKQHVMPWILSMGFLDGEWSTSKGVRFSAGMGFLETHCVEGMMSALFNQKEDPKRSLRFELFNTIQTSVSIPLSKKMLIRPETILVFKGTELVSGERYKAGPFNIYLNLVYTF